MFAVTLWPQHCLSQGLSIASVKEKWHLPILFSGSNYPIWLKCLVISIFSYFCFSVALIKEKWYWLDLVGIIQHAKKLSKYYQRFKHYGRFCLLIMDRHIDRQTHRRTHKVIVGHFSKIKFSIGQFF